MNTLYFISEIILSKMQCKRKLCRWIQFVLLVLSALLQVACLVAPGWWIVIHEESETYFGIFYVIKCNKTDCNTQSWYGMYHQLLAETTDKFSQLRNGKKLLIIIFRG